MLFLVPIEQGCGRRGRRSGCGLCPKTCRKGEALVETRITSAPPRHRQYNDAGAMQGLPRRGQTHARPLSLRSRVAPNIAADTVGETSIQHFMLRWGQACRR
jgi:hypothetical protein